MDNFEELRKGWQNEYSAQPNLDKKKVTDMIHHRRKTEVNRIMQYFWASFVYQLIVYSLLSHVIIRYWNNAEIVVPAAIGVALFIPFTFTLITRFRKVAVPPIALTLKEHIDTQIKLVSGFFRFKKAYELLLIPLSTLIGVHLCIKIFSTGGLLDHPILSTVLFIVSVLSCAYAIKRENDRNFARPLQELEALKSQCLD